MCMPTPTHTVATPACTSTYQHTSTHCMTCSVCHTITNIDMWVASHTSAKQSSRAVAPFGVGLDSLKCIQPICTQWGPRSPHGCGGHDPHMDPWGPWSPHGLGDHDPRMLMWLACGPHKGCGDHCPHMNYAGTMIPTWVWGPWPPHTGVGTMVPTWAW